MRTRTPGAAVVPVTLIVLAWMLIIVSLELPALTPRHDGWGDRDQPYSTGQVLLGLVFTAFWPPLTASDGGYLFWLPLLGASVCFVITCYAAVRRAVLPQRRAGYGWSVVRWGALCVWVPLVTCGATPGAGNMTHAGYYLLAAAFTAAFLASGALRVKRATRQCSGPGPQV